MCVCVFVRDSLNINMGATPGGLERRMIKRLNGEFLNENILYSFVVRMKGKEIRWRG